MSYKPTLPSSLLSIRDEGQVNFKKTIFGNNSLRVGVILDVANVGDEENISGLGPEYDVMTIEQDMDAGSNSVIYKNCIDIDSFGGAADFFQFSRRTSSNPKEARAQGSLKNQTGSIVLILCLDGNSEKAVILKSIHNPSRPAVITPDKGNHLEGEFNGLNWTIDNDGALTVTFKSPTEDDGTVTNESMGGSTLKIEKDGSVELTNQPTIEGDGAGDMVDFERIRLDRTEMTMEFEAREDISFTTDNNVNILAGSSMSTEVSENWALLAEGNAMVMTEGDINLTSEGAFSSTNQSVMMDSNSLFQVNAQSLFQVRAGSSAIINAPNVQLGPSAIQPALLGFQLLTIGTGNLGAPVVSNAIAGFSTSILLS